MSTNAIPYGSITVHKWQWQSIEDATNATNQKD